MPPKKPAASADDEAEVKFKSKRTKEIVESFLLDSIPPAEITQIVNKFIDSQGWPRAGGSDEPKATNSLVWTGDVKDGSDVPSTATLKGTVKALKQICPLHCKIKGMCFWRCAFLDEGVKPLADFIDKPIKQGIWEGLTVLELVECRLTEASCGILGEHLAANCPLKTLVLDFNPIGDRGAQSLCSQMVSNTVLGSLSLGYCELTSRCCEVVGEGAIRRAKLRSLNLQGNRLGVHVTSHGVTVQGGGLVALFAAAPNAVLFEEPPSRGESELDAIENVIKNEHKGKMIDVASFTYRATEGVWAGSDLRILTENVPVDEVDEDEKEGGGEEGGAGMAPPPPETFRKLVALTETLTFLNISNNCILPDVEEDELTVFASVTSTSEVIPIKETAVQAGAAYVGEGCYCQFGNELVQVVSLLHEGETFLVDEIDDKSQAIRLSTMRASVPEIAVYAGEALVLGGKETVIVTKVASNGLFHISRGESGTKGTRHDATTPVVKKCSVHVVRGAAFTAAAEHPCGAMLERVSVIRFMAEQLENLNLLQGLDLEHNNIGQDAAEYFEDVAKKLSLFKFSGLEVSEALFKEMYKDGTAKKKGKKKK